MFLWHSITAGLGPLLFHWGVGAAIIIICVGLVLCMQLLPLPVQNVLRPWEKDLLWVAVVVAIALGYGTVLVRDEAARCVAKQQVIEKFVGKTVETTKTPAARAKTDKYDSPDN